MALPNPLHYYALTESSGTAAAADTGTTPVNLSTVTGTPTVVTGPNGGNARKFVYSPLASVGQANDDASLIIGKGYDWTYAFWCKFNASALPAATESRIIERTNVAFTTIATSAGIPTSLKARGDDAVDRAIATKYELGNDSWHHVVCRFADSTKNYALWVDGVAVGNFTPSTWSPPTGATGNRWVFGNTLVALAHVAIFRSAPGGGGTLTDSQIPELYNTGAGNYWNGSAWSVAAAGTTSIVDDFNRADSYPSGLGTTSDGVVAWQTLSGTWGVVSNRARNNSQTNNKAVVNRGAADGVVQVRCYNLTNAGLMFRASNASNYCVAAVTPTTIQLHKVESGTFTTVGSAYSYTQSEGDLIGVRLEGSAVTLLVNGVAVLAPATITFNQDKTLHGLWTYLDSGVEFDDFTFADSLSSPLVAGTVDLVYSGTTGISLVASDASDGTGPYDYQWQRNDGSGYEDLVDGGGVSGATTLTLIDGSAVEGTVYGYRLVYSDAAAATATSAPFAAAVYDGRPLGGGSSQFFQSDQISGGW